MTTKLEQLIAAFEFYGYAVDVEPLEGQEDLLTEALAKGLVTIEETFAFNAKRFGFRGKSKPALEALHRSIPSPIWGVVVR